MTYKKIFLIKKSIKKRRISCWFQSRWKNAPKNHKQNKFDEHEKWKKCISPSRFCAPTKSPNHGPHNTLIKTHALTWTAHPKRPPWHEPHHHPQRPHDRTAQRGRPRNMDLTLINTPRMGWACYVHVLRACYVGVKTPKAEVKNIWNFVVVTKQSCPRLQKADSRCRRCRLPALHCECIVFIIYICCLAFAGLKGLCHEMNNGFEGLQNYTSTFCLCAVGFHNFRTAYFCDIELWTFYLLLWNC